MDVSDLPEPERLAYLQRQLENQHIDPGSCDDEAHAAFMRASPARRQRALRKAEIAALLVTLGSDVPWPERLRLVHERFGTDGASKPRLKAILTAVKGVDPINFAPALLDSHKGNPGGAEISPDAWRAFLTILRDAYRDFPVQQAWRDIRDVKDQNGWNWPSSRTIHRKWNALPAAQRIAIRDGREEAVRQIAQPALRDPGTLKAMDLLSLDGRTKDFWVDWGDGKAVRSTFLALVDCATGMVVGWKLARSENATDALQLIVEVSERHGIPKQIYPDNGRAFAGNLVAGGTGHRFRNPGRGTDEVQPLGVCQHLGIRLRFAIPRNGQAKRAERAFADLSRIIDDRPEFRGAHCGHGPGAAPDGGVVPVPVDVARRIIARDVDRYNREPGRRGIGMGGRSYEEAFRDQLEGQILSRPTERQLYLASLIYTPVAVDRHGRVHVDGWTYGSDATQDALLAYNGTGKILLGRDPRNLAAPAIAWNAAGELICEGIEVIKRTAYDSKEGARIAARNRKAARDKVAAGLAAENFMADEEMLEVLAGIAAPTSVLDGHVQAVVGGRFDAPLDRAARENPARTDLPDTPIPLEHRQNFAASLERMRVNREKSARGM